MLTERGKPFTLLKIDDVSNLGSLKLRVRLAHRVAAQRSQTRCCGHHKCGRRGGRHVET
jgi:predicted nucleotide-binding protein (sugar kinase/HSP70/actin superfamily)